MMLNQEPFRVTPAAPVTAYKTYALSAPIQTHTRPGTCAEVNCAHWLAGWKTTVDVSTELGQRQAKYIVNKSGRKFCETTGFGDINKQLREFMFPPGQKCFREHRVSLEREPAFIVRGGDWRGNPMREFRQHANGNDWVEDFAEHTDRIKRLRESG